MVGCMVGTSLAMAPAMLLAPRARFVDLDGPLLLARDRDDGLALRRQHRPSAVAGALGLSASARARQRARSARPTAASGTIAGRPAAPRGPEERAAQHRGARHGERAGGAEHALAPARAPPAGARCASAAMAPRWVAPKVRPCSVCRSERRGEARGRPRAPRSGRRPRRRRARSSPKRGGAAADAAAERREDEDLGDDADGPQVADGRAREPEVAPMDAAEGVERRVARLGAGARPPITNQRRAAGASRPRRGQLGASGRHAPAPIGHREPRRSPSRRRRARQEPDRPHRQAARRGCSRRRCSRPGTRSSPTGGCGRSRGAGRAGSPGW